MRSPLRARPYAPPQASPGAPPPPGAGSAGSASKDEPAHPHEPPPAHFAPDPLDLEFDRFTADAAGLFDQKPRSRRPPPEPLGRPVDLEAEFDRDDPEAVDLKRLYGDDAPEARLGDPRPSAEDDAEGVIGEEELEGAELDAEEEALDDVLLGFAEEAAAAERAAEEKEKERERAAAEEARGMHAGEGVGRREDVRG